MAKTLTLQAGGTVALCPRGKPVCRISDFVNSRPKFTFEGHIATLTRLLYNWFYMMSGHSLSGFYCIVLIWIWNNTEGGWNTRKMLLGHWLSDSIWSSSQEWRLFPPLMHAPTESLACSKFQNPFLSQFSRWSLSDFWPRLRVFPTSLCPHFTSKHNYSAPLQIKGFPHLCRWLV